LNDHAVDKTTASQNQFSLWNSILFHAFGYCLTIVYCLHYAMYILCEIINLKKLKEEIKKTNNSANHITLPFMTIPNFYYTISFK